MADVFLSYKREDAARVRKLVSALRDNGLDVWWDEDIVPSAPWEATIEAALANSAAVVVCWSPASVASENVRSEARVAREDGRLIQVFLKPCSPPLFFGERQGIDLTKWRGNTDDPRITKLAQTIRKAREGEPIGGEEQSRIVQGTSSARTIRQMVVIAAAFLVVLGAAGLIAWRAAVARPAPEVAVLPFEDLSPTHDKSYFAEGVAEEILSALSTDKAIKVLGRTSARQIDRNADPALLRKSLGITHLLEGSARTAGDALRVDVRLIDTRDGTTVWQDEYQGRLSDVFAVQDKVATAVVQHLRGMFLQAHAPAERPVTKVNVYETYLAARAIMRKRAEPTLRQAFSLAHQVITTDPNYAPGQALYAELAYLLSDDTLAYGPVPLRTAAPIAEEHARAAIRLAPSLADGYAALGLIPSIPDQEAIAALRRAVVLDPSRADVRVWLALRLNKLGRYDEALEQTRQAAASEPLWALPMEGLVESLTMYGRQVEARQAVEQYRARTGNDAQYHRLLFLIYLRGPNLSAAIAEGDKAHSIDPSLPDLRLNLMSLYFTLGLEERAPKDLPEAFGRLAKPFYAGDTNALDARIRAIGTGLWGLPDREIGFFHLAAIHDWTTLNRLYDARPGPAQQLCFGESEAAMISTEVLIPAVRAAGRQRDVAALMDCLRERLAIEMRQRAAGPAAYFGDYEYDQATLAALSGNRGAALSWLEQAVAKGWMGRPYSPSLTDRPQFDAFHADPRLAALQAKIDRAIAEQRAEVLTQQR